MNKIINTILLAADTFMGEVHLRPPGFRCTACEPVEKSKDRTNNLKKQEI